MLGRETFLAGVDWVDGWPVFEPEQFGVEPASTSFVDEFATPELEHRWVVPTGDLSKIEHDAPAGVNVPADTVLCTRVRALRWTAEAVIEATGGLQVRIDFRHAYGLVLECGTVRAFARIGGIESTLATAPAESGSVTLRIEAVEPANAPVLVGDAGPDDIVLSLAQGDEVTTLATLDGGYLSTEVAAGFTGRMLGVGASGVRTYARRVAYRRALPD